MITSVEDAVSRIDVILHYSKHIGLDPEQILAQVYTDHLLSDQSCDSCHMYGITFGEKINEIMLRRIESNDTGSK